MASNKKTSVASGGVDFREERPMKNEAAFATALRLWAESRDRAITDLHRKAADLSDQGRHDDAEHFRFVARLLTVRAIHERAVAAALGTPEMSRAACDAAST
jgi:hypothetical protein